MCKIVYGIACGSFWLMLSFARSPQLRLKSSVSMEERQAEVRHIVSWPIILPRNIPNASRTILRLEGMSTQRRSTTIDYIHDLVYSPPRRYHTTKDRRLLSTLRPHVNNETLKLIVG